MMRSPLQSLTRSLTQPRMLRFLRRSTLRPSIRVLPMMLAVGLLAACSSVPTRFYTLVAPATASAPAPSSAPYQFALLPVRIPEQVDQPQLVIRQSETQVAVLEGEQWSGPLGDQIHTALSADLVRRLGTRDIYGLPQGKDQAVYRIKLDVRRFESMPGAYALIAAAWSVRGKGGSQALSCTTTVRQPVTGVDYAALVQGYQRALATLATAVAGSVRSVANGSNSACP